MKKGFTLLEMVLVVGIISVLLTVVGVSTHGRYRKAKAQRTIEELKSLATAGVDYYLTNQTIPTSITDLISGGHLYSGTTQNPFGNSYLITATSKMVTISTIVPANVVGMITGMNHSITSSGTTVAFSKPIGYDLPGEAFQKKYYYGE